MVSCTTNEVDLAGHAGCLCHRPEIQFSDAPDRRGSFTTRLCRGRGRLGCIAWPAQTRQCAAGAGRRSQPSRPILFTNFRLFDGNSSTLRDGLRLLVEGNRIKAVAQGNPAAPDGAHVIDCGGRVLMPGLIDAHWHSIFAALPLSALMAADVGYIYLAASAEAERTLMRGFTTVRDLGGPAFALKQAIDEGLVPGPRIYPSGAMITATGGSWRPASVVRCAECRRHAQSRGTIRRQLIADSPDAVRLRVREQLMQAASQIKLVGSGGVSTPRSPLDAAGFTELELRAGVEAAEDWATYVTVHAYTPATIQRAIAAGARCIEHGHLMDEATAKLMSEKGIWLSIQPFVGDDDFICLTGESRVQQLRVLAGTDKAYTLAKNHKIKTAFGSDLLFSDTLTARQGTMLTHLTRWYATFEILRMATAANAELLELVRPTQSLSREVGGRGRGRACRSAARRWQSARGHQPHCESGPKLSHHHERWEDLQECT